MSRLFKVFLFTLSGLTLVSFNGKSQETEILITSRSSFIVKDLNIEKSFSFESKPISSSVAYNSLRNTENNNAFYRPMVPKGPNLSLYTFNGKTTYFEYKEQSLRDGILCMGLEILGAVLQGASAR
jgi:hypothetical protein